MKMNLSPKPEIIKLERAPIKSSRRNKYEALVAEMFSMAGIQMNGARPFDIIVKNQAFYKRILADGTLGLGESYMDGWWDCEKIDEMIYHLVRANLQNKLNKNPKFIFYALKARVFNSQT
jgi:cyclopropane-fatty-acyl-phospholipid synthase